ncbi:MAG: hydroxymethylbilane synthase [Clostridia bacterium]|nr:hydroxymethylbilane synthase [Clostridia bacterium]
MIMRVIRIGSRQSQLALWQAERVRKLLQLHQPLYQYKVVCLTTKGDKFIDVPLAKIGAQGLFTKELERALLEGKIDLAVHSAKDLPTRLPEGLAIGAMLKREDPRDALLAREGLQLYQLPPGAIVGTSSLRRKAQLLHARPDLKLVDLRGNIGTRVRRLENGEFDAIVLAVAGIERLGWQEKITQKLDYDLLLPAVGQGSIAVEAREDDEEIMTLIGQLDDQETRTAITAERAFLAALQGGCQVPIGAIAEVREGLLRLQGLVANLEGTTIIRDHLSGPAAAAVELGRALADSLLAQGAGEILASIRQGACR